MDQLTACNVRGVARTGESTENYRLTFSVCILVHSFGFHSFTNLIQSHCVAVFRGNALINPL